MLQYKSFTFDGKEDFINYIEKKMINYWEAHNNSFSNVCENLDVWDGFLGDDRVYPMYELDDYLGRRKPSDIFRMVNNAFNYFDNYFYYDGYGRLCSTNKKEYFNNFDYSEVFEKLADNYGQVFSHSYGSAYYELFNDVDNINYLDENDIQECMNYGCYDYLFVDDDKFFSDDDLDD